MQLTIQAPAKVNLLLKVLGRRPDGYHELATLMQPLDLADTLTVRLGEPGLRLSCDKPELSGENNLVIAAARAYYAALGQEPAAAFELIKRIPVAAGLGGGSSDAAAALLALNALHHGALEPQRLAALAAGLGADVPGRVHRLVHRHRRAGGALAGFPIAELGAGQSPLCPLHGACISTI